jgi:hypothetical protein
MHKKVLSEQFVITHKVADILKFDREKIVSNCVKNYFFNKRVQNEEWYEQFNYCVTDDHQHLSWLHDYIRDHYKVEYFETPIIVRRHGIVLENNASLGAHHHIDDWDLEGSPEISVLWCLEDRVEKSKVIFEYEFGRNKKLRYSLPLEKDKLIIFPSYLRHKITKNKNKDPIVALSFQFQLL